MKLVLRDIRMPLTNFPLVLDTELEGEVIALFGPSGSGKTSVLDLIAGLRKPASAYIEFDSVVLTNTAKSHSLPPNQRGIGYVPQDGALFPHLSVRANLMYGSKRVSKTPLFSVEYVTKVLEIAHTLSGVVSTLSGGEKQRVALARALLSQPRLLLLDEPMASLDQTLKAKSFAFLQRIRKEFCVPMIYVSHSAEEVAALCDTVMVLERGRNIRCGAPAKIFAQHNVAVLELR